MDFKSLRKLYTKEYCDNLVVLTSDIIQKYFNDLEVLFHEASSSCVEWPTVQCLQGIYQN